MGLDIHVHIALTSSFRKGVSTETRATVFLLGVPSIRPHITVSLVRQLSGTRLLLTMTVEHPVSRNTQTVWSNSVPLAIGIINSCWRPKLHVSAIIINGSLQPHDNVTLIFSIAPLSWLSGWSSMSSTLWRPSMHSAPMAPHVPWPIRIRQQ